jgi:hypothetical protein
MAPWVLMVDDDRWMALPLADFVRALKLKPIRGQCLVTKLGPGSSGDGSSDVENPYSICERHHWGFVVVQDKPAWIKRSEWECEPHLVTSADGMSRTFRAWEPTGSDSFAKLLSLETKRRLTKSIAKLPLLLTLHTEVVL